MRVHLLVAQKVGTDHMNYGMYERLCHGFNNRGTVVIGDTNPDIVHIFGLWNKRHLHLVSSFVKHGIPVVFTSLDGLIPLVECHHAPMQTYYVKKITSKATTIHVCGKVEESIIKQINKGTCLKNIKNPACTSCISDEEMISSMERVYKEAIAKHDKRIRESIHLQVETIHDCDETIKDICSQLLYVKYLLRRGGIPKEFIDKLATTLVENDYDEDEMANVLHRLGIDTFSSRTLKVMADLSGLTEGFMPIPSTDDKYTRKMEQYIVQN